MPTHLYVTPRGDDRNPGTKSKPLATLTGARNTLRKIPKSSRRNVTVWLAGGTYRVADTVVFSPADSAAPDGTITYSALPGQRPVLSAGAPITGWRKLTDAPKSLPAKARGKVYVADVPEGLEKFYTLFDAKGPLPRARCAGFTPPGKAAGWHTQDQHLMRFHRGDLKAWPHLRDVEISIVGSAPWTMNVLPLESVDLRKRVARMAVRGTYGLTKPRFGKFLSGNVFVENVFEGLTAPGTWLLDSTARKIYLWPRTGRPWGIVAPVLTEMVRIEGKIDYEGPKDVPVRGIVFRGLTFLHAERYTWRPDHPGWGLQHDWEMFDRPTAMLRLRGAEDCAVECCRFAHAGATAVRLDLHCRKNRIERCDIEHVGGAGVLLAGYGPGTKDVNGQNEVIGNHIHHVGEVYWHSAGIFVWQSAANRIAHNHIHHVPYTAIVLSGRIVWDRAGAAECSRTVRWAELEAAMGKDVSGSLPWRARERFLHSRRNVVEYNDLHDVMEMLEDGNCIYVSGCGAGNLVRQNYLHHCESIHMAEGIRCDDDQHDTIIDSNILFRLGGLATYIAIKGINHVTNNILAHAAAKTFRGMLSLEDVPIDGSVVQRNIFLSTRRSDTAVYQGRTYYKTDAWLHDCNADFNCYHNTSDANWGPAHLRRERTHGIELHSIAADPMFVNAAKGDFRLKPNSPVRALGFVPIETDRIGPCGPTGPAACRLAALPDL